jgi:hypothetical protein
MTSLLDARLPRHASASASASDGDGDGDGDGDQQTVVPLR